MMRRVCRADGNTKDRMATLLDSLNEIRDANQDLPPELQITHYNLGRVGATYVIVAHFGDGTTETGDVWYCTDCKQVREYFDGQISGCYNCGAEDDRLA